MDFTWNPVCDQFPPGYIWGCETGSPTVGFSPVPGEQGPVRIWADEGGSGQWVKLRGSGGAGGTAGGAIGLHYQAAAGQLSGEMSMVAKWAWNPTTGTGPYSYLTRGQYTVTATAVPNPIRLTESEADGDGIRTYTAEPVAGLQFSNPLEWPFVWPAGAQFWYWIYGDTVGTDPRSGGFGREIPECQFQSTCHYRPEAPGRMQLVAYVEGKAVRVRSVPAGACGSKAPANALMPSGLAGESCNAPAPVLVLRCNNMVDSVKVTRGERVSCVASASENTARIAVQGWTFVGGGLSLPRTGPGAQDASWSGPMVISGEVKVTASVNGEPATEKSVSVLVSDRVWPEAVPEVSEVSDGCETPTPPSGPCLLKYPPVYWHDLGRTYKRVVLENLAARAGHVDLGPNTGFSYVLGTSSPLRLAPIVVHINVMLFNSSDLFWRAHPECKREALLEWTRAHEARHVSFLIDAIRKGIANSYSIEAQVQYLPIEGFRQWLSRMEPDVMQYTQDVGDYRHYREEWNKNPAPCELDGILLPNPS